MYYSDKSCCLFLTVDEENEQKQNGQVREDLMELLPATNRPHPLHNEASTDSEDSIIIHEASSKV